MDELRKLLQENLNIDFISATLSNPRNKDAIQKVKVRPILKKDTLLFQLESFQNNQAFHENMEVEKACEKLLEHMENMKQMQLDTQGCSYSVLISKKGKVTIKSKLKKGDRKKINMSHDRKKKYVLEEGIPVPFLQDLGVMTQEGKIVHAKFDKFRQINRFLEFIEDILPELDKDRELTILDFGCGKSYLTFAMYYYLHELKSYDIRIIGLDLKKDVIRHCNELSEKYGYEKLKFLEGDIADYTGVNKVDMVVTLHACDTATDYALAKAVGWDAKVILSVPCCQHELNRQIKNEVLEPILKYGLLKERMAALITDGLRAEYLEREGYTAQILEFIDMEHTPKNILIRAVKNKKKKGQGDDAIRRCEAALRVTPTLGRLLDGYAVEEKPDED
nr:SAM-dependent methyltransferase [uncultured Dorea sp.]